MKEDGLKTFRGGGMDRNSAPEFIDLNDYELAYNFRVGGTSEHEEGLGSNPESTTLIPGTRAAGLNKGIGGRSFEDVRQIVMFIYNSAGNNQIAVYDLDTDTQSIIYTDKTDSGGETLLPLDPSHYVSCVLINETYLVWVAKNISVGYTNLKTLSAGLYGTVLAEDLSLIKPQCLLPITGTYINDKGRASNFLKNKLFQFIVQYVNADFNYSAWSTWSKRIIPAEENTPLVGTDVTANNGQILNVDIGSIRATTINIACRYGDFDFNIIKSVDRSYVVALPHTSVDISTEIYEAYDPTTNIYSFVFYNEDVSIGVAPTETDLAYDAVPLAANAVERINNNLLALADLTVGYPRPNTSVTVQGVGYNPNLTLPIPVGSNPWVVTDSFPGGSGSGAGDHKRIMTITLGGLPHTNDVITVTLADVRNASVTNVYSYIVPAGQDGDLAGVVATLSSILPSGSFVYSGGSTYTITFIGSPYFGLQSAAIVLYNIGATVSKSIHTFLDNSSYQAALSYRDKYGRFFPLCTNNTYIFQTPSFAQVNGNAVEFSWKINVSTAPEGAVDYQWVFTENNTVVKGALLDVLSNPLSYIGTWDAHANTPTLAANTGTVGDTYQITTPSIPGDNRNLGNGNQDFNTGDYVSYNGKSWDIISKSFGDLTTTGNILALKITPLKLFNDKYTNAGANTVLTYGFTPNDRCTLHYYVSGGVNNFINSPCVDLGVLGYDVASNIVKVEKSATFDETLIAGKDVYIRLYSPKQQSQAASAAQNTTVWFEVGERYTITNGLHDTLSGLITEGDVYFKTRQYSGAVDPNTPYDVLATDFNFSDFYGSEFTSYGRPRSYDDELESTERKAIITYSEKYILGSRRNGLTRFFPANVYGDGDGQTSSSNGAIQIMWQRNDVLVIGQELHFGYIPVNVSILEDAVEQKQYAISEKLFNNIRYNQTGNIGIGTAKESFCFYNNTGYFIDPHRSEPMEITLAGIAPISGKMSKFFKATLQLAYAQGKKLVMYYNTYYNEVMLCIQAEGGILTLFPFNNTEWNPFEPYTIVLGDILSESNGSHCTVSYNGATGDATYTPTTDYIGGDTAIFSYTSPTGPVSKNNCLTWIAGDTTVNAFSFIDKTGQPLSTLITSNTISVSGINIAVPISIVGGQYSINGGAFTSASGTVVNGDIVQVEVLSSGVNSTTTTTTLTISGTSAPFNVTTTAAGHFTVSAQYGYTIESVVGTTATGIPGSLASISVAPGNNLTVAYTAIVAGGINVTISGTPAIPGHIKLDLYYLGVFSNTINTPTSGVYGMTIPSGTNPDDYLIAVDSF